MIERMYSVLSYRNHTAMGIVWDDRTIGRFGLKWRKSDLLEHMLSVIFDVAGINHTVFCFYRTKVVSDQFFLNDPIGRCVVRKIPARDQPGRFIVGEMFQSLAAVAAQMIDHVVENCFFA